LKILITGINGFVGSHLAERCLKLPDTEVIGTIRYNHTGQELKNIEHIKDQVTLEHGDLTDYNFVFDVINRHKPDFIFHLAAQSFVKESFASPRMTLNNNINMQLNVLEAVRMLKLTDTVVHVACSSEEYGLVKPEECPISEKNALIPLSPYAVSKITQDFMAQNYYLTYGVKTIITRAFNHEGPRRGRDFVLSSFAEQIVKIENGLQEPIIKVGNLDSQRDFTHIDDMIRAYLLAVVECDYGTPYNIGTGETITIKEALNYMISKSTVKDIKIVQDKERMRPSDVVLLKCDATKFKKKTGWKPLKTTQNILFDILNYWREEYKK